MTPGVIGATAPLRDRARLDRGVEFWVVRTIGGTAVHPPTSEYYTVRASTLETSGAASDGYSTAHRRLLVQADEHGVRALESALRQSAGVQSVESEPAADGDYLDEHHSGVVTLHHGRIVDD